MTDRRHGDIWAGTPAAGRLPGVFGAALWAVAGAALVLGIGLASGLIHVGDSSPEAEGGRRLWTCGMHPEVIQDEPGLCPICHMELTPMGEEPVASQEPASGGSANGLWTCPMHSMIKEPEPGACPICAMDLVPVDPGQEASGPEVSVAPDVVQRMNVRTTRVERRDLMRTIRTVGHLDYDQEGMVSVTTRYEGFVERVYVHSDGEQVRRGQPLFDVYAPELVQTQEELLAAVRYARRLVDTDAESRRRAEAMVEAARRRLEAWEMPEKQIEAIESSGEVVRTVTVSSPVTGVVMRRLHGLQGMAIRPGVEALHVAHFSTLWLTVEVFEHQLAWIEAGDQAEIRFDYFPGEVFTAAVRTVEPEVSPQTRSVELVLEVPNPDGQLRVGMYATVEFRPVVVRDAVAVPAGAVIRSGERNVVVVALGEGRFVPREVRLGLEADGYVQVLQGIEAGEEIATSAQFLLDSESRLRAAVAGKRDAAMEHQH